MKKALYDKQLYVTCNEKYYLHTGKINEVTNLESSQEEADSTFFFIQHMGLMLNVKQLLYLQRIQMSLPYVLHLVILSHVHCTKSSQQRQVFDSSILKKKNNLSYGVDICQAILRVHVITGYDNVNSFDGKGKLIALVLSQRNIIVSQSLKTLGKD